MKKLSLNKFIRDPSNLSGMFLKLQKEYVSRGFKMEEALLHVSIMLAYPFSGKKKLDKFEIDKYSRIVIAVVDAFLWSMN